MGDREELPALCARPILALVGEQPDAVVVEGDLEVDADPLLIDHLDVVDEVQHDLAAGVER